MKYISLTLFIFVSCSLFKTQQETTPLKIVPIKNIRKMEGKWYVLAHIPLPFERSSFEATKIFELQTFDTLREIYRFKNESFSAVQQRYFYKGKIPDPRIRGHWLMNLNEFSSLHYYFQYMDSKYSLGIIGNGEGNMWVISRDKRISKKKWKFIKGKLKALGYEYKQLRFVPQEVDPSLGLPLNLTL